MIGNGGLWSCNVLTWAGGIVYLRPDGDGLAQYLPDGKGDSRLALFAFSVYFRVCISEWMGWDNGVCG